MCKLSIDHRQQNYYYYFNSWRPQGEDKEKKVRFNQKKRLLRKLRKQSKSSTSKLSFWLKIMCQANIKLHSVLVFKERFSPRFTFPAPRMERRQRRQRRRRRRRRQSQNLR